MKYGSYKCKVCGKQKRGVWRESDCYKLRLCAECLDDAGLGVPLKRIA